ncbi:serpin family protein [Candidatus Shapirobacteria bacterium]|nr:serpin family protein [Candidatus Shapirobacteria bacterium]
MTKKFLLIALIVVAVAGVATAAVLFLFPYNPAQPPRTDDTNSTPQGIKDVVNANNKFAFDLYSQLNKSEKGNIFYSPYSISAALAMTYEGAKGQTADEIKSVFHFPDNNILRPNFAAIYNGINKGTKDYELKTGNALWVQKNFPLLPDFTSRVEKYYGGKTANLDFIKESEKSRQVINDFIGEQTNNKIKDLIPPGSLDNMTRLVLTNAIYFKGTWQWEFDTSDTRNEDFKITVDNIVKVPMMKMNPEKASFNYADTEDAQILELPYKGDKISMLVILPTKDLASIESSLTAEKLNEYKSKMKETKLESISLPKFEFGTKYFMKDALSALGMPTAFSESADFSGITGKEDLYINFVIHQAYVKVDEKGTEAAGATAVGIETVADVPRFNANHPFIFIIQEKDTGNILFLGRVINPAN